MKILNKEDHFLYIYDLASRYSLPEMSKITGIGTTTLCSFINEHGIVLKSKEKHLRLLENIEKIKEDAKDMSVSDLAEKYKVSCSKMRRFMASNAILSKEKNLEAQIITFLKNTDKVLTMQELISKFMCHRSVIERICNKIEYTLKPAFKVQSLDSQIRDALESTYISEAAKLLGISSTALSQYARNNNIVTKKKPVKERLSGHVVYAYYDRLGIVRYYGEGSSEDRAYHFKGHKCKGYDKYFSEYNPEVKILHHGLTKEEALKIEQELVEENLKAECSVYNSPKTSRRKREIPFDVVSNLMYIDSSSPSGLRWKSGVESYGNRKADTIVGYKTINGYWTVKISEYGSFKTHCIVWLLHNKSIDLTKVIDHIDCNKDNNCLDNLRQVSYSANNKNKKTNSNTGFKGIHWSEKNKQYSVSWTEDGKRNHRSFLLSFYKEKEIALSAAKKFRDDLVLQGLIILTPSCH